MGLKIGTVVSTMPIDISITLPGDVNAALEDYATIHSAEHGVKRHQKK